MCAISLQYLLQNRFCVQTLDVIQTYQMLLFFVLLITNELRAALKLNGTPVFPVSIQVKMSLLRIIIFILLSIS